MKRKSLIAGAFAVALAAMPSSAVALTCPANIAGFDRQYTVSPASACVWGVGDINNSGQDDFLSGAGITGGDPTHPVPGNPILTTIDGTQVTSGAAAGWTAVTYNFDNNSFSDPNWSIAGFDPTKQYLVAIKDGNQNPGWAVFLVTASSGTWSTNPADAWSHGVLYSRTGPSTTTNTQPPVPEPASLLLLGSGLIFAAQRFRRRRTTES